MTPERWQQLEELYHAALVRASEGRAASAPHSGGSGPSARKSSPQPKTKPPPIFEDHANPAPFAIGERVGQYVILEQLGRGGMGEGPRGRARPPF